MDLNQSILKVDILDPQPQRLADSHATTVEQFYDDKMHSVQLIEHSLDFCSAQYCRNLFSFAGSNRFDRPDVTPEDVFEKKQQRVKGLVLSRRCHIPIHGEIR